MISKLLVVAILSLIAGPQVAAAPAAKSRRNMVTGTVDTSADAGGRHLLNALAGAVAVAYGLDSKPIGVSAVTRSDGHFELIVDESVTSFQILVQDVEARYWEYKPKVLISNKTHPHDLGVILLSSKHDLSLAELEEQLLGAKILHAVNGSLAALQLERVTKAWAQNLSNDHDYGCPALSSRVKAHPVAVTYRLHAEQAFEVDLLYIRLGLEGLEAARVHGIEYWKEPGLGPAHTPGYCMERRLGFTVAVPIYDWLPRLIARRDGPIRYLPEGAKSFDEGIPIAEDFPLGIDFGGHKAR